MGRYIFIDTVPFSGYNYYRVKSIDISGNGSYSEIVRVAMPVVTSDTEIKVYPNPVTGKMIYLQFNHVEKGSYVIQLFNESGQLIAAGTIEHTAGNTEKFSIPKDIAAGKYELRISGTGVKLSVPILKR